MFDENERLLDVARLLTDEVMSLVGWLSPEAQIAHIARRLDCLAPRLGELFMIALRRWPIRSALCHVLWDFIADETARILGALDGTHVALGLGAVGPPSATKVVEADDVAQHNDAPSKKRGKSWTEWQGHLYRGLWYPGYQTSIVDLTPDDVGLASAYLAGKLTQKGCPKSDKAKKAHSWNLAYKIVHGIEMVAGIVASVVMTVFYGPLGGLITSYLHKAKMAVLDRFWKVKVEKDPAFRALVEKLDPTEPYTYNGFRFQLRPYGNLLVQELACKADLRTRLLMHGRMMRTLDVLAASSPTAKSAPGRYDYLSSFGMLKGSIFPPHGPKYDGTPPAPKVQAQAKQVIMSAPIQAVIKQPAASLSATVQTIKGGPPLPPGVAQSAALLRARVQAHTAAQLEHVKAEKPASRTWLFLLGGAALGAAFLATR
jgi:hypothetical protein